MRKKRILFCSEATFLNTGYQQPLGEAPPGKVWSPEHGHWHDIE